MKNKYKSTSPNPKKNNIDKEKWIIAVLDSVEGSKQAKPSKHLFAKIESEFYDSTQNNIISIRQVRIVAAAIALLLLLNIGFVYYTLQTSRTLESQLYIDKQYLISNYKLYIQ